MSKVPQTQPRSAAEVMYELARLIHTGTVPAPWYIMVAGLVTIQVASLDELAAWREFLAAGAEYTSHSATRDDGTVMRWTKIHARRLGWGWDVSYMLPDDPAPEPTPEPFDPHTDVHPEPGDQVAPPPPYIANVLDGPVTMIDAPAVGTLTDPIGDIR